MFHLEVLKIIFANLMIHSCPNFQQPKIRFGHYQIQFPQFIQPNLSSFMTFLLKMRIVLLIFFLFFSFFFLLIEYIGLRMRSTLQKLEKGLIHFLCIKNKNTLCKAINWNGRRQSQNTLTFPNVIVFSEISIASCSSSYFNNSNYINDSRIYDKFTILSCQCYKPIIKRRSYFIFYLKSHKVAVK